MCEILENFSEVELVVESVLWIFFRIVFKNQKTRIVILFGFIVSSQLDKVNKIIPISWIFMILWHTYKESNRNLKSLPRNSIYLCCHKKMDILHAYHGLYDIPKRPLHIFEHAFMVKVPEVWFACTSDSSSRNMLEPK